MKKIILVILMLVSFTILLSGCFYPACCVRPIQYDGAYKGKVIDADTGDPIEGVVILGTWDTVFSGVAGGVSEYYDAKETVTDRNGEFTLPGVGLRLNIINKLDSVYVLMFKTGYEYVDGPWESLKASFYYKDKIKWEGNKSTIPLRRLTSEERRKHSSLPSRPSAPTKKMKLMTKEIDRARREQGLEPLSEGGED
ncbi:MAG: carboxypeptidase-like regulatory domain-containing protein [Nitrospirota bacterium]